MCPILSYLFQKLNKTEVIISTIVPAHYNRIMWPISEKMVKNVLNSSNEYPPIYVFISKEDYDIELV